MMIENGWVPVRVTSPDNTRETIPLSISIWTHVDIRKAIDNVDRKDIPIKHSDALETTLNLDGMVIDIIAIGLQLRRRMDTTSTSKSSILMHDDNHGTMLRDSNGTSRHNWDIRNLMVIKALNVNTAKCSQDDTCVQTSQSAIGPTIHQTHACWTVEWTT